MTRFFCTALLGALALPSLAQTTPDTPRVTVSLGSFLPEGSDNDRHSQTSFSYWPKLKGAGILSGASVYLDTFRHKTVPTATSTKITATEGLGLSLRGNVIPLNKQGVYQLAGVGLYRRRTSTTVTTGTGATAVTTTTSTTGYAPGIKAGIGYQLKSVFVEATYTSVSKIKGSDPSGLTLSFGLRL